MGCAFLPLGITYCDGHQHVDSVAGLVHRIFHFNGHRLRRLHIHHVLPGSNEKCRGQWREDGCTVLSPSCRLHRRFFNVNIHVHLYAGVHGGWVCSECLLSKRYGNNL